MAKGDPAGGRILRSLVEPPEPVVEDEPPPVRRGRKPGSKNKPKLQPAVAAEVAGADGVAERPRRGRKPGSKNRPKVPVTAAFPPLTPDGAYDAAAAMRSYGFADDGTVWGHAAPTREPASIPAVSAPAVPAETADGSAPDTGRPRPRLRDRSTILKRYVLDLEPRPGQPGAMRARRLARAAR